MADPIKKPSWITEKQLKRLNIYLDITSRMVPLCFALFIVIGAIAIWLYLAKYKLTSEFAQLISTYQVLFQLSLFSLILTCIVLLAIFIGPLLYRDASSEVYSISGWSKKVFAFDMVVVFITISTQLMVVKYLLYPAWFSIVAIVLIAFVILLYRKRCAGSCSNPKSSAFLDKFSAFMFYVFSLYLMFLPLLFLVLIASKTLPSNWKGFLLFGLYLSIYSFVASLFISKKDKVATIILFTVIVIFFFFKEDSLDFFIQQYGLSQYNTTISVENKYTAILDYDSEVFKKKQPALNRESSLYKNIWVIVDLPSSIIFSASSSSKKYILIPKAGITGKLLDKTPHRVPGLEK